MGLDLDWRRDPSSAQSWIGLRLRGEAGRTRVSAVLANGPAWGSGLSAGDEIVALNGFRVDDSSLDGRLHDYRPGETVRIAAFRRDELIEIPLVLTERPAFRATVRKAGRANVRQRALYEAWMHAPW